MIVLYGYYWPFGTWFLKHHVALGFASSYMHELLKHFRLANNIVTNFYCLLFYRVLHTVCIKKETDEARRGD